MDDAFFRDLIGHALSCGAADACVDEDRSILDIDQLDHGRVTQHHDAQTTIALYVQIGKACIAVHLQDMPSSTLTFAKKKVDEALSAAHLVDAWSTAPNAGALPPLMEDDTFRYIDPFDDDPDAFQKRQKAFDAFLKSPASERAPILLKEFADFARLGDRFSLFARQTIARRIQRRITASDITTSHSGFTRLERTIFHFGDKTTASIRLPEYNQTGYGIQPDSPESAEIMSVADIAVHYGLSASSDATLTEDAPSVIFGAWATNVILHETIHQSPYYLGQTEAVAIDRNRGILQCSGPHNSCSAYAIHPTTPEVLSLAQILADVPDDALYVDAPTFVTRYSDKTIDVTFSIVRKIHQHALDMAFRPATLKIIPHLFWKSIRIAFGPLCRISMKCQNGEPTFQSPGVWVDAPSQTILGKT